MTLQGVQAQYDPSFSHYWAMETAYNPAAAGKQNKVNVVVDYNMSLVGFEHNPKTMFLSADLPFQFLGTYHGVGAQIVNDDIGVFSHKKFSVMYAPKIKLLGGVLSLGIQPAMLSETLKGSELDFIDSGDEALPTSNVDGTQNVLDMCIKHNVNKIIFTSSNCLWGKNFDYKVTEDEAPAPVEIYGKSKLEGEKILMSAKGTVNSVIFRCPTIMDEGRLGLLAILYEFVDENKKLWMVGKGNNTYQFIYAKDLANACMLALDYNKSEIFNIGSDDVKSFNYIYQYVVDHSDSTSKLGHLPPNLAKLAMKVSYYLGISPLGVYQYNMISSSFVFDTTKIKRELNWQPTLKNEEMLLKSYNYFHENKEEIKNRTNVSAHNREADMGLAIRILKFFS